MVIAVATGMGLGRNNDEKKQKKTERKKKRKCGGRCTGGPPLSSPSSRPRIGLLCSAVLLLFVSVVSHHLVARKGREAESERGRDGQTDRDREREGEREGESGNVLQDTCHRVPYSFRHRALFPLFSRSVCASLARKYFPPFPLPCSSLCPPHGSLSRHGSSLFPHGCSLSPPLPVPSPTLPIPAGL